MQMSLVFLGNCWDDWKVALKGGIHKNRVHFEELTIFFMRFQSLQSNTPIVNPGPGFLNEEFCCHLPFLSSLSRASH